ncbi:MULTISPECIES: DUF4320 family protein [Bacillota]|uniref:DUF4320 family protein n=1 Tax=Bacillota TaxID=1239 RepID=UPI0039EF4FA7
MLQIRSKLLLMKKSLKDEKGSIDSLIAFIGSLLMGITFTLGVVTLYDYIVHATELNDLADTTIKDAMQANGGLTPEVETYVFQVLENKGFDVSRVTLTGTQKGSVNFGEPMTANLEYQYNFPFFQPSASLLPLIEVNPIPISADIYGISLEVVR